jgi:hypothetical protein
MISCCATSIALVSLSAFPQDSNPGRIHFENVTASSGISFTPTSGRTPSSQILEVKAGGLALVDFDADGDRDLLIPNGATLDSPHKGPGGRVFENVGAGEGKIRFVDATEKTGLAFDRWGFGPCAFDADNDGRDDVYIACYGPNALLMNRDGKFVDEAATRGCVGGESDWTTAAACGDLDLDGDLDLYAVNYLTFDPKSPPAPSTFLNVKVFSGPKGLPAQPDRVFLNRGDGTFEEATSKLGFDRVEAGYGLGAIILDFDRNGSPEVFVGNDSGKNNFFVRQADGTFVDEGTRSGIATNGDGIEQATMGIGIGDVNGDGLADCFSTNFMNDTNTLQVQLPRRQFSDQTSLYGLGIVSRPYLGWATSFVDFDHDGDEDTIVFNGHVYPREITDPHNWGHVQEPLVFRRDAKRFERVRGDAVGAFAEEKHCDRGAAFDDLDGDGDIDIIVTALNEPIRVLENDGAAGASTIVTLRDERKDSRNRAGIGAKITLECAGKKSTRWIHPGGSYQASNPKHAHFAGFGDAKEGAFEVVWPDGTTQKESVTLERNVTLVRRD